MAEGADYVSVRWDELDALRAIARAAEDARRAQTTAGWVTSLDPLWEAVTALHYVQHRAAAMTPE